MAEGENLLPRHAETKPEDVRPGLVDGVDDLALRRRVGADSRCHSRRVEIGIKRLACARRLCHDRLRRAEQKKARAALLGERATS